MTNGRGAGMASFMTKKKKYKFQVEISIEELLEVPFVSAVLFAKLRLLDGGNFQDHSTRQEVKDHTVKWGSKFSFPCKMMANASTGVLERCVLRISVRKECKGGRSFTKLGFVDINLAEYAGAGEISKKALLEGYDARHRQDNSLLKYSIKMHMLSGDILFKVPSPSLKHKQIGSSNSDDNNADVRTLDELSSNSLAGSIASGSSGFGSLTKKRPPLLSSDLVIGHTLNEGNVGLRLSDDIPSGLTADSEDAHCEHGHSRNSSNTSQMSKASGYSSIHSHSHSRQSSSGDSGHIRDARKPKRITTACNIPTTHPELPTPNNTPQKHTPNGIANGNLSVYHTPKSYQSQISQISSDNSDDFRTPEDTLDSQWLENCFDLQKSFSCDTVKLKEHAEKQNKKDEKQLAEGVLRSKSEFQIPRKSNRKSFEKFVKKSDNLFSLLTPIAKRKNLNGNTFNTSTPKHNSDGFKVPSSPVPASQAPRYPGFHQNRTSSLNSLRFGNHGTDGFANQAIHRNPSSSSLVLSETGSLDRAKTALEKRKKAVGQLSDGEAISSAGRVEETRVNPNHLIEELLKNTNLEPTDDSGENSGLQLFIAKDGTASLGNHEVKSQMSTGQHFKQVVMEDNR